MNLFEFFRNLWKTQRFLMITGLAGFILTVILIIAALFDSRQILGINRWIKPIKFAASGGIYLWTAAIYLYYLPAYKKSVPIIAWGTAAAMIGEVLLIVIQAARGTTSHFNFKTPLDGAIFGAMGLMILFNTLLIVYLAALYFRAEINLPKALVWGMRLGLIVFLLGSLQGGYMSGQSGHTVGSGDGGAGLPLVNWSIESGDLRVAHFLGLHALQTIPLFALMVVCVQKRFSLVRPTALTIIFAVLYLASFSLTFVQAARGVPLLGKQTLPASQKEIMKVNNNHGN